ncbi:MAG: NFACT RNA binding domain-containing protein [Lentisphaeria bacterium]
MEKKEQTFQSAKTWNYDLNEEWHVFAGKTDEDNDILSTEQAKKNAYWFHVHGQPGSHVILQGPERQKPSKGLLKMAAAIAAWHSKARNGGACTVDYTLACFVTKPKHVHAGTVTITHQKTIKIKPELPPTRP